MRDLPQVVARAVGRLGEYHQGIIRRTGAYKEIDVSKRQAHDLVIRAFDAKAITATQIPKVLEEWRKPKHPEFEGRNLWSLYNGFTEVMKGSLWQMPKRNEALHGVLDIEAEILPS